MGGLLDFRSGILIFNFLYLMVIEDILCVFGLMILFVLEVFWEFVILIRDKDCGIVEWGLIKVI